MNPFLPVIESVLALFLSRTRSSLCRTRLPKLLGEDVGDGDGNGDSLRSPLLGRKETGVSFPTPGALP